MDKRVYIIDNFSSRTEIIPLKKSVSQKNTIEGINVIFTNNYDSDPLSQWK